MANRHNKSFFGQKTGMILDSDSKNKPHIFLTFIKKLQNNSWERFKEGKTIRFSLEEQINILEVLKENQNEWKTIHRFGNDTTNIEVVWEQGERRALSIRAGPYKKMLYNSEILLLELMLTHILKEKIEFATIPQQKTSLKEMESSPENLYIVEEQFDNNGNVIATENEEESTEIQGTIKSETSKALCINFGNKDVWVPKSTIKSKYNSSTDQEQPFVIDTWLLKKNEVLT